MWGLFCHDKIHLTPRRKPDHSCFGRDHAHQRIDLYPVEGPRLRTTISIHVSRSLKGTGGDQTTTGLQRAINLPGRQPVSPLEAASSETPTSLWLCFERGAFRHDALLDKPPEGDHQLASQGNDANLSPPHALAAEPLVPPQRELAVRLVAKPEPSKLDKRLSRELRPRFVDPAISTYFATRVRTWRKSDE